MDIDFIYNSTFDDNETLLFSVPIERGGTNGGDANMGLFIADIDRVNPKSPLSGRAFVNNTADARNVRVKPLRGIWDTAPFLHHGRAATLLDVLTTFGTERHRMAGLSLNEARNLAAFLQSVE
jgi:cytochrome c peroxidase